MNLVRGVLVQSFVVDYFKAGDAKIGFNQAVFLSERETANRNRALAYFMASKGGFPQDKSPISDALDFYFQRTCVVQFINWLSICSLFD